MQFLHTVWIQSRQNWAVIFIASMFLGEAWWGVIRKRYMLTALMILVSAFVLEFSAGLLRWISGLGGGSFLEVIRFDLREAWAWLSTFFSTLPLMAEQPKVVMLTTTEAVMLSVCLWLVMRKRPKIRFVLRLLLSVGVVFCVTEGVHAFARERAFTRHLETQFNAHPEGFWTEKDIDLLVYIGESTTTLNMSLYGYPQKTTPQLDALAQNDAGFVRLQKVYAHILTRL